MSKERLVTVIHPNGVIAKVTVGGKGHAPLDMLQKLVGGYIELVPGFTMYEGRKATVYCNGEGKLESLAYNEKATKLWYERMPGMRGHDILVGAIVIDQPAAKKPNVEICGKCHGKGDLSKLGANVPGAKCPACNGEGKIYADQTGSNGNSSSGISQSAPRSKK